MRIGKVLLLAMTLALGVTTAFAQSIDITLDAAGMICEGSPTSGSNIYILARPGGAVAGGISGAEFWCSGLPAGWFAISTASPASSLDLGNPFATTSPFRANINFPACQPPDMNGVVLLYTVTLFPNSSPPDTYLSVEVANPPSNAAFETPMLIACDAPDYTAYPAAGGQFILFPDTRHCTIAVESTTWSGVKSLYGK